MRSNDSISESREMLKKVNDSVMNWLRLDNYLLAVEYGR
jgi:hypothetical protein